MARQRKLMNQINVVPYVDVMLVLLVIFMVTAPLVTPSVIDLPTVGKAQQPPEAPMEVVIKADGAMLLRDRAKGTPTERPVSMDQLLAAIREKQSRSPEQAVVIGADKEVKYDYVLKVMDQLQRQNVKRVGLLVRPPG
jgi:biopolymer transport protein TolR